MGNAQGDSCLRRGFLESSPATLSTRYLDICTRLSLPYTQKASPATPILSWKSLDLYPAQLHDKVRSHISLPRGMSILSSGCLPLPGQYVQGPQQPSRLISGAVRCPLSRQSRLRPTAAAFRITAAAPATQSPADKKARPGEKKGALFLYLV